MCYECGIMLGYNIIILVSYPPAFQCCMRKTREPGKTYHTSDLVGVTDLYNSSGTKSSWFHDPLSTSLA